ncbi:MAG TPA: Grx4 family monothiol glutaredoxin [Alphaproteobacteria bacterium]|jgi:monothiol glutaredoxin|nr:Grx4 family monothiol glutaredoxin [Alphaproteobacteria bacterium]HIB17697.1 Grx4 family monothiol glutaredoxin [Alphaproteobacteria bacterium]HIB55689.1 Grx4 family monothiol glutaredoxin [Alphaproteobacteria bacterium]HIN91874.1 Grx4 family monothiol glutaredoxin [Alphaproteobacteria bacterium]
MTATQDNPALERIEQEINDHPVVLFMKGTPIFPQCGFSAMVIQVLTQMGAKFKSIDVLNEPTIRDGIKQYSDWPTIPQLYVKGEFIGGSDIVREMYESGELAELFSNKGVELEDA